MAFHIEMTHSNGYRCSCCQSDWDSSEWAESLEDALESVPIILVDGEPHCFNGDVEITKVTVKDGSTGEEVAWASATCPGFRDYGGYSYTRWSGYRPDSGGFDVMYSGKTKIDKTWDEVYAELTEKRRERELKKAQRDLEDAQGRLASLSKG